MYAAGVIAHVFLQWPSGSGSGVNDWERNGTVHTIRSPTDTLYTYKYIHDTYLGGKTGAWQMESGWKLQVVYVQCCPRYLLPCVTVTIKNVPTGFHLAGSPPLERPRRQVGWTGWTFSLHRVYTRYIHDIPTYIKNMYVDTRRYTTLFMYNENMGYKVYRRLFSHPRSTPWCFYLPTMLLQSRCTVLV